MGSLKLSGNDFITKGPFSTLDDGTVVINKASNPDYVIGMVSKDVFTFNTNKSVVFTFKADPFTEKRRLPLAWFSENNFTYLNSKKEWIINGNVIQTAQSEKIKIKGSDKYIGMLDGNILYIYNLKTEANNSSSASASGSGDANPLIINNVIDFDVTDDAYGYISIDDNKSQVHIIADNTDNPITKTEGNVNGYKDNSKKPIKISIGANISLVLLSDATVVTTGINNPFTENYIQIEADKQIIGAVDINNKLTIINLSTGDINNINQVGFFSIGADGTVATVKTDGSSDLSNLGYPVEVYTSNNKKIVVFRNGKYISTNDNIKDLLPFKIIKTNNPDFELYPILQNENAFNVLFGVETNNVDTNIFKEYVNKLGETTPIIVGDKDNGSVFKSLARNVKGFFYSKYKNGSDVFFSSKGQNLGDFAVEGANVLPSQLIDFQNNLYKVVISFTPFGKSLRVFKEINGQFNEIKAKFLSLEEDPFPSGRICLYIKSASSFHLMEVEITDELDVTLLPEEIIYRDIDTDILQTKVAESLNKHIAMGDSLMFAIEEQTKVLQKITEQAQAKFGDLDARLKKLGG